MRDRLTLSRDLLCDSGSVFVQIGDANVHRVRALLDEVFGEDNLIAQIQIKKSGGATSQYLSGVTDFVVWYANARSRSNTVPCFRNVTLKGEEAATLSLRHLMVTLVLQPIASCAMGFATRLAV